MEKISILKLFIIFGIVISLNTLIVSAYYIPNIPQLNIKGYTVYPFEDNSGQTTVPGSYPNNKTEELYNAGLSASIPWFTMGHNGKDYLCVRVVMPDETEQKDDYVAIYIGKKSYSLYRDGSIKELFDNWTVGQTIQISEINSEGITYHSENLYHLIYGFPPKNELEGWLFDLCIPYSVMNITVGSASTFSMYITGYDNDEGNYHWPNHSTVYSIIDSSNYWAQDDNWCENNTYCEDSEYCMLAANPSLNKCTAVTVGSCGEVSNHSWMSYECCDNSDCNVGNICSNNFCVVSTDVEQNTTNNSITNPPSENTTSNVVECGGNLNSKILYNTNTEKLSVNLNSLENCEGKNIEVRENSCLGNIVCYFTSDSDGGSCEFNMPSSSGIHSYSVCSDLDDDGTVEYTKFYLTIESSNNNSSNDNNFVNELNNNNNSANESINNTNVDNGNEVNADTNSSNDYFNQFVTELEGDVNSVKETGANTSVAETKIEQAKEAYSSGNTKLANDLLDEAQKSLNQNGNQKGDADGNMIVYILSGVIAIIVIGIGTYYLAVKKK